MKIVNLGSLNVDYVYRVEDFLRPGETRPARSRSVNAGGKGLNQSIALARAGCEVWHAGAVGDDGAVLTDTLAAAGVRLDLLRRMDGPGGHTVIQVTDRGENCILLFGGTNRRLTEAYVDEVLDACAPEDVLLLQNETNLVPYAITRAAARGLRVALNAAPAGGAEDYPLHKLRWLVVNELEGAAIAGTDAYDAMLERLAARCPQTGVLLTLGAAGARYRDGGGETREPAYPVRELIDTTAAGDTFLGFFLAALLAGADDGAALRRAAAASALAIARPGAAASIPIAAEVDAALAGA